MGHYGGKMRDGERSGASNAKKAKEMMHHRLKNDSPEKQSIADRKKRLVQLREDISRQFDPIRREVLYEQFANAAASFPPTVFTPDELGGIVKESSFYDNDSLSSIFHSGARGHSMRFTLPLHHLVKLLAKEVVSPGFVPQSRQEQYVCLLGMEYADKVGDKNIFNLRALEVFILGFSGMIRQGKSFGLNINGNSIQVPHSLDPYFSENSPHLQVVRKALLSNSVRAEECYSVSRVRDGDYKIDAKMHIRSDLVGFSQEGRRVNVLTSYFGLK